MPLPLLLPLPLPLPVPVPLCMCMGIHLCRRAVVMFRQLPCCGVNCITEEVNFNWSGIENKA